MTAPEAQPPPSRCPACGHVLDAVHEVHGDDATPTPGDFSLCVMCASVLVFDERLVLTIPTHAQLREAPEDLWGVQDAIKKIAQVEPRYERLPCGCMTGVEEVDGRRTFVFIPHALDCQYLAHVRDEAHRAGKELTVIDAR